ncbi:MAG: prepilin-type N-terminal cleavage/methylation domain-containing protein [bacterium]|nr:prepilin-type N-terminal cleavage/methylation domain-containing protein [bacterium]
MRRGFTLIEVLTVMAIIGILASLGAYTYAASLTRSRDSQRITDLQFIRNGLEQFYLDNRHYPIFQGDGDKAEATWQLEQLDSGTCQDPKKFLAPKYLNQIPQDPTYKFNIESCNMVAEGQYLYFGLPKDSSKTGFYLMARMERALNINYTSSVSDVLINEDYDISSLNFCTTIAPGCSQNAFVTNSKND